MNEVIFEAAGLDEHNLYRFKVVSTVSRIAVEAVDCTLRTCKPCTYTSHSMMMSMGMIRWCASTLLSVVPVCLRQHDDLKLTHRLGGTFLSCLLAVAFGGTEVTRGYAIVLAGVALLLPKQRPRRKNAGYYEDDDSDEDDDRDEDDVLSAVGLNSIMICSAIVAFDLSLRVDDEGNNDFLTILLLFFSIALMFLYPFYLVYCKIWMDRGMADPATFLFAFFAAFQMAGLFEALAISRS